MQNRYRWHIPTGKVEFSDSWFESLGYNPKEFEHNLDAWKKLLHPDDTSKVNDTLTYHFKKKSFELKKKLFQISSSLTFDKISLLEVDCDLGAGKPGAGSGIEMLKEAIKKQHDLRSTCEQIMVDINDTSSSARASKIKADTVTPHARHIEVITQVDPVFVVGSSIIQDHDLSMFRFGKDLTIKGQFLVKLFTRSHACINYWNILLWF